MKSNKSTTWLNKIIILLLITTTMSCVTSKEIVYFQDEAITESTQTTINSGLVYKPNDILYINVAGDRDAVAPFNMPAISYGNSSVYASASLKMQTYLIDNSGNIDFPILGTITLSGLTREEATLLLKNKILEHVKAPIINIRLINFTITVLGSVNSPGTFTIEDEKISITEAIGLAGDLTIFGKRENVLLIREQNGVKKFTKFDLTSVNALNSPNYYLEQNDLIYVEPNKARVKSASYNQNNGLIISAVATLATIVAILIK